MEQPWLKNCIDKIILSDYNGGFDTIYICLPDDHELLKFNIDKCTKKLEEYEIELKYYYDFQDKIEAKIGNENFMKGAPKAIVDKEITKYNDNWIIIGDLETKILDLNISMVYSKNINNCLNS